MITRTDSGSAGTAVKWLAAVAGILLSAALLWGLRSLILPVAAGALLAYICYPIVRGLERFKLTRGLAIGLLLLAFVSAGLFLVNRVRAGIPDDAGVLELRVRALHNVNERYKALMGLDPSLTKGNRLYRWARNDLDPLVDRVNRFLALTPEEQERFSSSRPERVRPPLLSDPIHDYYRENLKTARAAGTRASRPGTSGAGSDCPGPEESPEDAPGRAGRRPLHLGRRSRGFPVSPARYRRDQARLSARFAKPAFRARARHPGGPRSRARRLRARHLPRELRSGGLCGAASHGPRCAGQLGDPDRARLGRGQPRPLYRFRRRRFTRCCR